VESLKKALDGFIAWLRGLRLPVRIAVPGRDELAAAGLTTLAVGLAVGLVIGPGIKPGPFMMMAPPPLVGSASPTSESTAALPELGSPAGATDVASGPVDAVPAAPVQTAAAPISPPVQVPSGAPVVTPAGKGSGGGGREPGGDSDSLPLVATVVSVSVTGKSYAVADKFGNLISIFAGKSPAIGTRVRTGIRPLANGTFLQGKERENLGRARESAIRGVVSYLDRQSGVIVVSSRGVSIALNGEGLLGEDIPDSRLGANVEAKVSLTPAPRLTADQSETEEEPIPDPAPGLRILTIGFEYYKETAIELTGRLEKLDPEARRAEFSADSGGLLRRSVAAELPPSVPLRQLTLSRLYSVTLREDRSGALRVTGFSPAWSDRKANDASLAFGEQGP
jgi:hypothetical protein